MDKLDHAKDIEELSGTVTVKQRKCQPSLLAKLIAQPRTPETPPTLPKAPPGPRGRGPNRH
jgi:hypothetical protein